MASRTRPTVLSVFSGAGGMDIGLEAAGFETVGVVEIDPIARQTLALNRPSWRQLGDGDITTVAKTVRPADLGLRRRQLDLLAGGPPCQPFSAAAQWASTGRRGMRDPRAQTVDAFIELVDRFLPKTILIENVLGFVQGRHSALEYLRSELTRIGESSGIHYQLEYRILNAANFGVPQNRRRAILIASRLQGPIEWPDSTTEYFSRTTWDALHDLDEEVAAKPRGKWASLLPTIPVGKNYLWHTQGGGGFELFGDRTRYWNFLLKLSPHTQSWTLAASPGPSTGPFHWNNRPLTPREFLRLQSFPDLWRLAGTTRQQVKQAGNATPPLLAEVMGSYIKRLLLKQKPSLDLTLLRDAASLPTPSLGEPEPLPREFAALIGPKFAHAGEGLGPGARSATDLENL